MKDDFSEITNILLVDDTYLIVEITTRFNRQFADTELIENIRRDYYGIDLVNDEAGYFGSSPKETDAPASRLFPGKRGLVHAFDGIVGYLPIL